MTAAEWKRYLRPDELIFSGFDIYVYVGSSMDVELRITASHSILVLNSGWEVKER